MNPGSLLAIGNPLLDISAHVEENLLKKYDLHPGNAILADQKKHLPLYEELIKNYRVQYIAGGAAQNSIRAAQWMLQCPKVTAYIGSIGKDDNGNKLKEVAEKEGITTHYWRDPNTPTGTCAVLVVQKERSLVANLGAAERYNKQQHLDSDEIQQVIARAQYIYCTGFFLTHGTESLLSLGKHACQHNKYFLMNLSAPFLIEHFFDQMKQVLPFTDVIFCNDNEAETLGKKLNWGTNLSEIAKKLSEFPKENNSHKRTVIFTQGSKSTLVLHNGELKQYSVPPVPSSEIVDTNGAGDSFVGGFLSRFIQQKPIGECVAAGHYCAAECIKRSGCSFPPKPQFKYVG